MMGEVNNIRKMPAAWTAPTTLHTIARDLLEIILEGEWADEDRDDLLIALTGIVKVASHRKDEARVTPSPPVVLHTPLPRLENLYPVRRDILRYLAATGMPTTQTLFAALAPLSPATLYRHLRRLKAQGYIVCPIFGHYTLTAQGQEAVAAENR